MGGTSGLVRSMMAGNNTPQGAALSQDSPASAGYDPSLTVPSYPPMPQGSPVADMHLKAAMARRAGGGQPAQPAPQSASQTPSQSITLPVQDSNPQQPGVQVNPTEAELIIKAMTDRMKHLSKKDEHVLGMNAPKVMGQ